MLLCKCLKTSDWCMRTTEKRGLTWSNNVVPLPPCSYRLRLIPHLQVQHWTEKGKQKSKRKSTKRVEGKKRKYKDAVVVDGLADREGGPWCRRPTRLSSPPPRRSIAPICMPEVVGGGGPVVVVGVRSRLSRSPRRSPWDGMTAGGVSVAAAPGSGLSTLSPLVERKKNERLSRAFHAIHLIITYKEKYRKTAEWLQ